MKGVIDNWYLILIVGFIFVILGVYTMILPLKSYLAFVLIFGISFLFAGILEIIFAISNTKELDEWIWTFVYGIINFLAGVLLITNPEISILTLPVYTGFILLFRSVMTIVIYFDFRKSGISGLDSWLGIGIAGLIFSLILLWNPSFAGLSLVIWRSIALITVGMYSISFSFKIKSLCIRMKHVCKT